jgi:hypothetical protein
VERLFFTGSCRGCKARQIVAVLTHGPWAAPDSHARKKRDLSATPTE